MSRVGFIGLGAMGTRMVANLLKAGYQVVVYDIRKDAVEEAVRLGAEPALTSKDVACESEVVLLSLPSSPQVEEAMLDAHGVLAGAREGSIVVDLSTIDPTTTRNLSKKSKEKNVRFIDAPVSGRPSGAEKATLTIMVGCDDEETFQEAKKILRSLGKTIVHVGPTGSGQVCKLANNMMACVTLLGVIEAFTWAVKQGLKPAALLEVASSGSSDSWTLRANLPKILERAFEPDFKAEYMHKDVGLYLKTATDLNLYTPFGGLAHQFLQAAKGMGLSNEDWRAVVKVYEKITGVELRT